MTVNEYKEKFEELFRALDREHGHLEHVQIFSSYLTASNGEIVDIDVKTVIQFRS